MAERNGAIRARHQRHPSGARDAFATSGTRRRRACSFLRLQEIDQLRKSAFRRDGLADRCGSATLSRGRAPTRPDRARPMRLAAPRVARVVEQVDDAIRPRRVEPERLEVEIDRAGLRRVVVEVHDVRIDVALVGACSWNRRAGWGCRRGGTAAARCAGAPGCARRAAFTRADQRRAGVRRRSGPRCAAGTSRSRGIPRCPARAASPRPARRPGRRCRSSLDSVAASTRRASNAAGPPVCRSAWRMSGVFGQKFGRKKSRDRRPRDLRRGTPPARRGSLRQVK